MISVINVPYVIIMINRINNNNIPQNYFLFFHYPQGMTQIYLLSAHWYSSHFYFTGLLYSLGKLPNVLLYTLKNSKRITYALPT